MKTVTTNTGQVLQARDARGLVRALRVRSFAPAATMRAFRQELAARAHEQTGCKVRIDSDVHLIADLLTLGLLFEGDLTPPEDPGCGQPSK